MAFRMLVKDLLVLVQAVNEGVVNLLGEPASFPLLEMTDEPRARRTLL